MTDLQTDPVFAQIIKLENNINQRRWRKQGTGIDESYRWSITRLSEVENLGSLKSIKAVSGRNQNKTCVLTLLCVSACLFIESDYCPVV